MATLCLPAKTQTSQSDVAKFCFNEADITVFIETKVKLNSCEARFIACDSTLKKVVSESKTLEYAVKQHDKLINQCNTLCNTTLQDTKTLYDKQISEIKRNNLKSKFKVGTIMFGVGVVVGLFLF